MELDYIENGLTKKNGRRKTRKRRRNPATAKATGAKRRNGTTKAGALSYAKKNGLKMVSRTAQNGKRKHHRRKKRNGITATPRARNGFFGNTKQDAKQVGALLGGMGVTKVAGRIINNFLSPFAAQMGLGQYSNIVSDGLVALVAVPWLGGKILGKDGAQFGRLGGLGVVAMDIIDAVAPNALGQFNPFNNSAVVLNNGQPLLTPAAAVTLVNQTDASPAAKSAVAGAMAQLAAGGGYSEAGAGYSPVSQLPLWD